MDDRSEANSTTDTLVQGATGLRHEWFRGATLTAALEVADFDLSQTNHRAVDFGDRQFRLRTVIERPERFVNLQIQQVIRADRHQFTAGVEAHHNDKAIAARVVFDEPDLAGIGELLGRTTIAGEDRELAAWLRAELRPWLRTHITAGTRYSALRYFEPAAESTFESRRWLPMVGLSVEVRPDTFVRAAAFRQVNSNQFGGRISATTIEGFVLDRNDLAATVRDEINVSVETRRWNAFHLLHGYHQRVESRLADALDAPQPSRRTGIEYRVNQVLTDRWTFFASNSIAHSQSAREGLVGGSPSVERLRAGLGLEKDQYVRWDNRLQAGVNFIHERGWLVRLQHAILVQRFTNTPVSDLDDGTYNTTDIDVSYELADKRGPLGAQMRNVADQPFIPFVDALVSGFPEVRRQIAATIRWRF